MDQISFVMGTWKSLVVSLQLSHQPDRVRVRYRMHCSSLVVSHSALVWKQQLIFSGGDIMEGQRTCFVAATAGTEELHMMDLRASGGF